MGNIFVVVPVFTFWTSLYGTVPQFGELKGNRQFCCRQILLELLLVCECVRVLVGRTGTFRLLVTTQWLGSQEIPRKDVRTDWEHNLF
jgi:hypothetical protein